MRPRARAPGAHTLATASTAACASASAFTEVSVCQGAMPLDAAQATDGLGQGRGRTPATALAGGVRPPYLPSCQTCLKTGPGMPVPPPPLPACLPRTESTGLVRRANLHLIRPARALRARRKGRPWSHVRLGLGQHGLDTSDRGAAGAGAGAPDAMRGLPLTALARLGSMRYRPIGHRQLASAAPAGSRRGAARRTNARERLRHHWQPQCAGPGGCARR